MLKPNNIKAKTFETVRNGYDPDDVHAFLAEVAKDYASALSSSEDNEAKIIKLVEKINEYRADEDAIKDAMINAQKEASKTISDAKAKARDMIESAKTEQVRLAEQSASECERIIREHKEKCAQLIKENTEITEKKITEIRDQLEKEKSEYESLKSEITYFKANLIELYNKQLHLIMEIPETKTEEVIEEPVTEDLPEDAADQAADESEEKNEEASKDEKIEKILNTVSFESVIPKENFADLKFGKNK